MVVGPSAPGGRPLRSRVHDDVGGIAHFGWVPRPGLYGRQRALHASRRAGDHPSSCPLKHLLPAPGGS
jgi:hypothetical protein